MQRLLEAYRSSSSGIAVGLLVVVNLVPLAGVLWWGWDLWSILVLYWVENGIVGVVNVMKILLAEGPMLGTGALGLASGIGGLGIGGRIGVALFFCVHYGIFWIGHGLFVLVFLPLITGFADFGLTPELPGNTVPFMPFQLSVAPDWSLVWAAAAGLALSHGTSFVLNYVGRREYRTTSPAALMAAPYGRVVVLHLTIIFGAFVVVAIGSPVGALVVLVALKTLLDVAFHLREHRSVALTDPLPVA